MIRYAMSLRVSASMCKGVHRHPRPDTARRRRELAEAAQKVRLVARDWAADDDRGDFVLGMVAGMRALLFITLPAAAFLLLSYSVGSIVPHGESCCPLVVTNHNQSRASSDGRAEC
jgi:hypothetical protein